MKDPTELARTILAELKAYRGTFCYRCKSLYLTVEFQAHRMRAGQIWENAQ
jgi:hypothetical protein